MLMNSKNNSKFDMWDYKFLRIKGAFSPLKIVMYEWRECEMLRSMNDVNLKCLGMKSKLDYLKILTRYWLNHEISIRLIRPNYIITPWDLGQLQIDPLGFWFCNITIEVFKLVKLTHLSTYMVDFLLKEICHYRHPILPPTFHS